MAGLGCLNAVELCKGCGGWNRWCDAASLGDRSPIIRGAGGGGVGYVGGDVWTGERRLTKGGVSREKHSQFVKTLTLMDKFLNRSYGQKLTSQEISFPKNIDWESASGRVTGR